MTTVTELYQPYLCGDIPYSYLTYHDGACAYAVRAFVRYLADPLMQREPSYLELRPVIEYCEYYLAAPMWVTPKRDLLMLRSAIEHVRTAQELERWLYECGGLGIEPL